MSMILGNGLSFESWLRDSRTAGTVRILSGFRSVGKTTLVRAAVKDFASEAPDEKVVYIDVESVAYQAMRTAELLWAHIVRTCPKGTFRLVLDEPGLFAELVQLLRLVRDSGRCASLLLLCSNAWRFAEIESEFPVTRYHLRDRRAPVLPDDEMDATWYKTLVRDILCPSRCMDGAGIWHLGSWLSEHFGEVTSLRKIAGSISQYGSRFSHPTVDAYLKALANAFLVDRVECWDVFAGTVSKSGFRLAVNYPKQLVHCFAVDKVAMAKAIVWNEAYLALRREHEAVYYPKNGPGDFVTVDAGRVTCWAVQGGRPVPVEP